MSSERNEEEITAGTRQRSDDATGGAAGAGDDERENCKHIAETGEPERDALGNADGAS